MGEGASKGRGEHDSNYARENPNSRVQTKVRKSKEEDKHWIMKCKGEHKTRYTGGQKLYEHIIKLSLWLQCWFKMYVQQHICGINYSKANDLVSWKLIQIWLILTRVLVYVLIKLKLNTNIFNYKLSNNRDGLSGMHG